MQIVSVSGLFNFIIAAINSGSTNEDLSGFADYIVAVGLDGPTNDP